jgi:hypothetical protein
MSRMTWRSLLNTLVLHERLDDSVTVYDAAEGEYYPADLIEFEEADDVLDKGHMFISINT